MAYLSLRRIKIMALEYRVIHLSVFLGGVVLLFSGIGSSPGALNRLLGSSPIAIHDALGVTSIAVLVGYGVYLLVLHRLRLFDGLKKSAPDQMTESKAIVQSYVMGKDIPVDVRQGMTRHNVLVGYATVLLSVAFAQLMVSGILLMVLGSASPFHGILLQVHNYGIELTALFLALHFFAVFMRANRPLLRAVFTDGTVPLSWAASQMKRYLDEVLKGQ